MNRESANPAEGGLARVGAPAPAFDLPSTLGRPTSRRQERLSEHAGRWLVLVFYPRDFTFVCPTELIELSARHDEFRRRNGEIVAISVDDLETHERWIATPPRDGGVGPLQFPLASDPDGAAARAFGVWIEDKQVANRGLFMVDPEGIVQYAVVHNLDVGRSPGEVLRVLDALRSGGLCPTGWKRGDGTIDPAQLLKPGRVLGRYRIERPLGHGAFGRVLAAWDLWLERMVAIKVGAPGTRADLSRVLAEARSAAALNHPNICTIYAVEEEEGLPVIAMEHLSGETLAHRLKQGPMVGDEVRRVARDVADGLVASHAAEVVHGDLKPANVMITDDGRAVILDFGIAVKRGKVPRPRLPSISGSATTAETEAPRTAETVAEGDSGGDGRRSAPGLRGTPGYMAPEQLTGALATPASDTFSFGLLLFEMLTGERAITGLTVTDIIARLGTLEHCELVAQVPPEWRLLLEGALNRDPDYRWSMERVREAL